jgi:hypothetical protein
MILLLELHIAHLYQRTVEIADADRFFDFRDLVGHREGYRGGGYGGVNLQLRQRGGDPEDPFMVAVEPVITQLIIDPHTDERRTAYSEGETEDIDEGKSFLAEKIPDSDFDIITDHG